MSVPKEDVVAKPDKSSERGSAKLDPSVNIAKGPCNDSKDMVDAGGAIFEYEFGGPAGALATTLALPVVVLVLARFASVGHVDLVWLRSALSDPVSPSVLCPGCDGDLSVLILSVGGITAWFLFQVFLERVLPCELVKGSSLPDGKGTRLLYRINGHLAFWATLLFAEVGWPRWESDSLTGNSRLQFGRAPLTLLYDYYSELAMATILLSSALSIYLYLRSFRSGLLLSKGGNSGNSFYDFFLGRELNPRWGSFDWKEFCELRPGLIGWALLNMGMMAKQQEKMGYVSGSMILVNIFQFIYVWDALYQERDILTTMDITADGFGFMLVFGDLAWVPFTYSLQARYLVDNDPNLSALALSTVVATNFFGYYIFREDNGKKDAFRRDPNVPELAHLTFLQTK